MVDETSLENWHTGNCIVSSNLTTSAKSLFFDIKEKQIMETLSFILGMAIVVVVAVAIVAVYAFVKVIKLQDNLKQLDRELSLRESNLYQAINEENRQINQRVDLFETNVYSQLDSRLDKLQNKLNNTK